MAVDPIQLATDQLEPVLLLDTTIEAAIGRQIEAQIALQKLSQPLEDDQAVYVSVLAVKALIPRLLLKFAQEVKRAKGGNSEAEFYDAIEFLKALQAELTAQVKQAAKEAAPEDVLDEARPGQPTVGVRGF